MTCLGRNICGIITILCILNVSHSWRPFEIVFYDPSFSVAFPKVLDFNLTIDENGFVSFYFNFKQDFSHPHIHIEYLFDDGRGNYNLVYVNKTLNICKFLANRNSDIVLRIILTVGEKFGTMPKRCPLKKEQFYVKNMKVAADYLPPVMPEKKGVLTFTIMSKVRDKFQTYINVTLYFKLDRVFKTKQVK